MGVLDKAKGAVGVSKGQHDAVDDLSNLCPTLSFQQVSETTENDLKIAHLTGARSLRQQRVIGFCICFVLGCKQ